MSDEAVNIDIDQPEPAADAGELKEAPPADAPPEEAKPAVTFSDEQQAKFNDEIGKKVAKQREAERAAEEATARLAETEAKLAQATAPMRPAVPEMPDPYDDDFEVKVKARDEALVLAAQYDAATQQAEQRKNYEAQQTAHKAQEELITTVKSYTERAEKLGVNAAELQQAGNMVAQYGIGNEVASYILNEDQGPSITVYLSKNPLELEQIRQMGPMQAAVYIENNIKAKAVASRPPPTPGPEPIDNPTGAGMPEGERGPKGAVYE